VVCGDGNAPPKPDDAPGLRGFVMRQVISFAGAGVASANRITLLRDTDGDGVAETRTSFLEGLHSPYGITLIGPLRIARALSKEGGPQSRRRRLV
jgi:glucose/arabinose dehydrogenase